MIIKVECTCGTRFEFEVEPVHGRMPVRINCPACGLDATAAANAIIETQSHPQPAAASPPPPAHPSAPAEHQGLRIAKSASTHAPVASPSPAVPAQIEVPQQVGEPAAANEASKPCHKHHSEPAADVCCVCAKPICLICMEQFGHVCSVYCRQQATLKRIYVPVYARQKSVVTGKLQRMGRRISYAVAALLLSLLAFWVWYGWFARNPKIVYTVAIPKSDSRLKNSYREDEFYDLIAPNQLLSIKSKRLTLLDVTQQKELWSVPLQNEAETGLVKAARAKNDEIIKRTPKVYDVDTNVEMTRYAGLDPLGYEDDFAFANPHVIATINDIWICFPNRLARFDRSTGSRKEVPIHDQIFSVTHGNEAILVVSGNSQGPAVLTRIALPEGTAQTEDISTPTPPQASKVEVKNNSSSNKAAMSTETAEKTQAESARKLKSSLGQAMVAGGMNATSTVSKAKQKAADEESILDMFDSYQHPYVLAGPNVMQFKTKLLEQKMISHETMKPKGKSIMESGNLTAGQSMDAAQEVLNDMRREQGGGVTQEDVSRYQVTLHRRFAKDIPDWTGEVTGPPAFFPLKTVDVVAAGQAISVFNKSNKKLWDAKLTYSVASRYSEEQAPCLETKDALYFADLGILARYDLATGTVRWRLNSVGISRIQADERGKLYINTTTAGPESIKYSEQINIHDKIHPVILKVDPETGKVLWRLDSVGDECLLSDKFLYATRVSTAYAALRLEEGPDTHFNLNLLDPSNGNVIWNYHEGNRRIIRTEVQKNWILLHFDDKVIVLKFFSL
ncbi:MAG: Pyrrolo-quinoline quinone [Pedosphaera sp.]|nr:Pyrrolo-quinoline quinone [Pedosphaera sp.]